MDIYIKESNGAQEIRIQWLPDKIQCVSNGTRMASFDIINQGEVNLPNGTNLSEFKWESKLPGYGHDNLPFLRGSWTDPKNIQTIWSKWRAEMTPLTLIVTGTPINHDVYLSDYNVTYEGGAGDYSYDIVFKARRKDINIPVTTMQRTVAVASGGGGGKSYTIVKGDTLWGIARRFLGSGTKWNIVYNANSSIIESTAKKHGKKGSDNGHWIYPGTVITIPGSSAGNSSGSSTVNSSGSSTNSSGGSSSVVVGSKDNPPFTIKDSSGKKVITNTIFITWTSVSIYYQGNKGASKGWKIYDANNKVVEI